jgi:hypothetical protein
MLAGFSQCSEDTLSDMQGLYEFIRISGGASTRRAGAASRAPTLHVQGIVVEKISLLKSLLGKKLINMTTL